MAPVNPEAHHSSTGARNSLPKEQAHVAKEAVSPKDSTSSTSPKRSLKRSTWYDRTWPRKKAAPVSQVAIESISSVSATTSEVTSSAAPSTIIRTKRSPSDKLTFGEAQSQRSSPAHATTTKVNAVSQTPIASRTKSDHISRGKSENKGTEDAMGKGVVQGDDNSGNATSISLPQANETKTALQGEPTEEPGWLAWFFKTNNEPGKRNSELHSQPPEISTQSHTDMQVPPQSFEEDRQTPTKRSWYQMWNGGSSKEDKNAPEDLPAGIDSANSAIDVSSPPEGSALPAEVSPPNFSGDGSKTAGWVFWSRYRKPASSVSTPNEQHVGEIAVSDTPSQKSPRKASVSLPGPKDTTSLEPQSVVNKIPGPSGPKESSTLQSRDSGMATHTRSISESQKEGVTTPTSARFPPSDIRSPKAPQVPSPNLLLPPCHETFSTRESSGLFQSLGRFLSYNRSSESEHLHLVREVPKLKSALAIGVHGYFPAPFIRTMLGQPTGTSIKFADMAAKAIRKWTESRGYSCEVKTAALEGEGRIAERVELLWKLLLNWIDEIRKADFIMIGCHSQGVPVAMMLVAKLVSFGCANSARISVCAMAGVSLGPFPDYKSRWISGTAGELFDFSNASSTVSKDYIAAIETVLKFGVRIVYVGSIDDQLVSLESAIFAPISHPHIYRAVFVDGRIHAPNFLVHLVGFALKLRNLGVQDHGLIRELSGPLAGSLYTGEGHSRIYEDEAVYDLAVEFSLGTNALRDRPLSQKPGSSTGPLSSSNPYILPWAVRGILEEDLVKSDLRDEARELLRQFDDWRPTTKALKDVKFRLEGIRSKL